MKNLVSHSNIKTKSKSFPNVQKKRLYSRVLNKLVTLRIATSTIRAIEHTGGLDKYILNQAAADLSVRALAIRKQIKDVMAGRRAQA